MRLIALTVASLAAGLASASAQPPAAAAPLPSVVLPPELDRVLRDYERAWGARDAGGLAALFAEDGFVLQNGMPPARGRAAIREAYANSGGPLLLRALGFAQEGAVGYIVGGFASAPGQPDGGKFVLALRRGADGRWLIAADIDNPNTRPGASPPASLTARRAELLAADRQYAADGARSGAADAVAAMLADDAVYVAPGSAVARGPAGARAAFAAALARDTLAAREPGGGESRLTWAPLRADVSADGTQGYTYGYQQLTRPNGTTVPWRYIAYWRREGGTTPRWRVVAYRHAAGSGGALGGAAPAGFETPTADRPAPLPPVSAAAAREAMADADRAFSDSGRRDMGAAFAHFAAADAALLGFGPTITFGREAIGAAFAPVPAGEIAWRPDVAAVAPGGDLGFTVGTAERRRANADGTYTVLGSWRYLSVWRRQADGTWRFVADG